MALDMALQALAGGALIGVAVTLMLLFNGRVTGISGIISSAWPIPDREGLWRGFFLAGLILGGAAMHGLNPELFVNLTDRSLWVALFAGALVGFGTLLGSGCTSGHGICGLSRFSVRSAVATLVFMLFGFLSVQIVRLFSGGLS